MCYVFPACVYFIAVCCVVFSLFGTTTSVLYWLPQSGVIIVANHDVVTLVELRYPSARPWDVRSFCFFAKQEGRHRTDTVRGAIDNITSLAVQTFARRHHNRLSNVFTEPVIVTVCGRRKPGIP